MIPKNIIKNADNPRIPNGIPTIKSLAKHENKDIRTEAIISIGIFGHPDDYDFLISRLGPNNPHEDWNHIYANPAKVEWEVIERLSCYIYALYEYEDLRAIPHLIPLLKIENKELRTEVVNALLYLLTPESLETLYKYSREVKKTNNRKEIKENVDDLLEELSISWENYLKLSSEDKNELIINYHDERFKKRYIIDDIEKVLTHGQLLKIIKEWKKKASIYLLGDEISSKRFKKINEAHIFSVATPEDLNLFLEVRADLNMRLSDECLYEIRDLEALIKLLSRKRYKQIIGISKKVEAIKI